jgi:peptidoglycan hydrolase-like protein with peptidoglycan-binding domain
MNTITRASFFLLALSCCIPIARSQTPPGTGAPVSDQPALATPELIRQIQFMLLSVSIDPGPIDGNAQQFTNRAVRTFEERNGLPQVDLANGRPVPPDFLAKLRSQVAQNLLKSGGKDQQATQAPSDQQTTAAIRPPAPADTAPAKPAPAPPPAPDRFASCSYNPDDFRIGGVQYTPQAFLDQGFGGVTARALTNLKQRLEEARQIAERIGGPALVEVQRQARVIAYFECRGKIEQANN